MISPQPIHPVEKRSVELGNASYASRGDLQLVTFFLGNELFAVPMTSVREIIRMPAVARLPMAAAHMLGLANLRGSLLPVADLSRLMLGQASHLTEATRVMIAEFGNPVGLVVDHVDKVIAVDADHLEPAIHLEDTISSEMLSGIIKNAGGHDMILVLDLDHLLGQELARVARFGTRQTDARSLHTDHKASHPQEEESKIVVFSLNDEEFAFPIDRVEEIIRLPEEISHLPKAPPYLLGLVNIRQRLIPLVSLRQRFGFPPDEMGEMNKVIILSVHAGETSHTVGILTDQVHAVQRVPLSQLEKLPRLYQKRQAHVEIEAICNLEDGARLISVLAADRLLDAESLHLVIHASRGGAAMSVSSSSGKESDTEEQFVVFRLASEEYGVPIHSVQEIIRVPELLTHVPNTPAYIEGMVNLRGMLLPVIDLRTRMALAREPRNDQQRIVVFTNAHGKTGFIVDSVTEVLKIPMSLIETTPDMAGDMGHLLTSVANLPSRNRMVLILDVEHLMRKENSHALSQEQEKLP